MFNRRSFMLKSVAVLAASAVSIPLTACDSSKIEPILNSVLTSASAVLKVAEPNAPWLPQYQNAVSALQSAEVQWKAGGSIVIVTNALNTLAAVSAVIPITAPYSPLIDVLVVGIESLLTAIAPSSPALQKATFNPHRGRAVLLKPHVTESVSSAYKRQWNEVIETHPELAPASLK